MDHEDALATGAMALFGEKYGDDRPRRHDRRLLEGALRRHARRGDRRDRADRHHAETSVASGVRRIEALTGRGALAYLRSLQDAGEALFAQFRTRAPEQLPAQVNGLRERVRDLERENRTG